MKLFAPLAMKIAGVIGIAMLAYIGLLHLNLAAERDLTAKWQRAAIEEQMAHKQTVANYRTAAEAARRADLENKRRVEAEQERITNDARTDYNRRLAELRARYDGLLAKAKTDPGSRGGSAVSGLPGAPERADGATCDLGLSERLVASEQAFRLKALQDWVREQTGVERPAVPGLVRYNFQ